MKKQDLTQLGRSMVEMLGVLAVIGVLSILGIIGYKKAMTKHYANEIFNEAHKRAVVTSSHIQMNMNSGRLSDFTNNDLGFASFSSDVITDGLYGKFGIQVSGVDDKVCNQLLEMSGNDSVLRQVSTVSDLFNTTNCQNTDKSYVLIFNNDLSTATVEAPPLDCTGETPICPVDAVIAGTELQCPCTCPEGREVANGHCGNCVGETEKYVAWTQPILSANGTMGGDSFAAAQSSTHMSCYAYLVFDNITEQTYSGWHSAANVSLPQWIAWYNPYPLKINSFSIKNRADGATYIKNFELQYSDDNSTWSLAMSGENESGRNHVTNFQVNNATAHKYWRIYVTSAYQDYRWVFIDTLTLSAEELQIVPYALNPTTFVCE